MSVHQGDYKGDGSKELPKSFVNGKLRVYRHFGLLGEGEDVMKPIGLKPMGQSSYNEQSEIYPYDNDFRASCHLSSGKGADHVVPVHSCTCGFYASYSPDTDFYSTHTGYRAFAAVRVSGRVIMGSKGVRAERMEFEGIWVQPKIRQVHLDHMTALRDARKSESWFRNAWVLYDAVTSALRMRAAPLGTKMKIECEALTQGLIDVAGAAAFEDYETALRKAGTMPLIMPDTKNIEKYGVPIFQTREELLEAFPPDDVSSLIRITEV